MVPVMTDDDPEELLGELIKQAGYLAAEVAIVRLLVEVLFATELIKASGGKEQALDHLDKLWKALSDEVGRPKSAGRYQSLSDKGAEALTRELDKILEAFASESARRIERLACIPWPPAVRLTPICSSLHLRRIPARKRRRQHRRCCRGAPAKAFSRCTRASER